MSDYSKTNNTVIIYGPQGCGKTTHAIQLQKFFGCTGIVDNFGGVGEDTVLSISDLHLTNVRTLPLIISSGALSKNKRIIMMSYRAAMAEMTEAKIRRTEGRRWWKPRPGLINKESRDE